MSRIPGITKRVETSVTTITNPQGSSSGIARPASSGGAIARPRQASGRGRPCPATSTPGTGRGRPASSGIARPAPSGIARAAGSGIARPASCGVPRPPPCKQTAPEITSAGTDSTRIRAVSKRDSRSGEGRQLGKVAPAECKIEKPSLLQKKVFEKALRDSMQVPGKKVRAMGAASTQVGQPKVMTKRGKECVVQQMKVQTQVQRTPMAEYIGKTMTGIDVDPTGIVRKLEVTSQQIDPTHGTESAGVNESVEVTSELSITGGGKQIKKLFKKKTLISQKLAKKPNMNPHHVKRLVIEEVEDVENTLRMVPPDLVSPSLDKYPLRKKLQNLRLSAEPVSLLTQSVIYNAPTADELDVEAPPEVVASVINAVEKGATPETGTTQIFNSLFPQVEEPRMDVSCVAPGPLEDMVVPTGQPPKLVEEILTEDMEDFLLAEVQNKQELPKDDICTTNNIAPQERPPKGQGTVPVLDIEGELPPWEDATVRKLATLVGGDPIEDLNASNYESFESPADISLELAKGIDYFIDADVVPYDTKIQIRGSKIPKWFPGYMAAFPHLPEIVKISRTPSEVLTAAWKAVQPKIFPEDSLLIV